MPTGRHWSWPCARGRHEVFSGSEGAFSRFRTDANAVRVALNALQDDKASTRRLAVEMLTKMNANSSIPALVKTLDDSDAEVRLTAVRALSNLGADDAAGSVVRLLSDPDATCPRRCVGGADKTAN